MVCSFGGQNHGGQNEWDHVVAGGAGGEDQFHEDKTRQRNVTWVE